MKKIISFFGFIIFLSTFYLNNIVYAETRSIGFATVFPDLIFKHQLSREEQTYLGIHGKRSYRLNDMKGSLLLIEILNIYCVNCVRQAPVLNDVYFLIEGDTRLKEKVKMIGIAAGNNIEEVNFFKEKFKIPYPILPDPDFYVHQLIGSPRTPFLIWVRKDREGRGVVVSTHLGAIESHDNVIEEIRASLQYDLSLLKLKIGKIYDVNHLIPPISEEELYKKAKQGMETSGGKIIEIKKVNLKDGDSIYIGKLDFNGVKKILFSKLASRRAVCDVCHDTFFIYTFNSLGKIVDIIPIQLTKTGNKNWTEDDIKKLKERIIGRSIFKPFSFNPKVDAISGATITAVLIFDTLEKAKEIYEKLREEGYISN